MKHFFADWRNPALLFSAMLIILLVSLAIIQQAKSMDKVVVKAGDKIITRQDVMDEIKRRPGSSSQGRYTLGNEIVMELIDFNMLEKYAAQKKVTASDSEIDQFLKPEALRASIGGKTLEATLKEQGTTLERQRMDIANLIKRIKLIVPSDDIKQGLRAYAEGNPYFIPEYHQYRQFIVTEEKTAKEVAALVKDPAKLAQAAQMCENAADAETILVHMPDVPRGEPPVVLEALKKLKPGQVATPFSVDLPNNMKLWVIVQLVEHAPAVKTTLENSSMRIGYSLLPEQKYEKARVELNSEILRKIEAKFETTEFQQAYDAIKTMQEQNLQVPMAPQTIPGLDSGPAPAPPASSGK